MLQPQWRLVCQDYKDTESRAQKQALLLLQGCIYGDNPLHLLVCIRYLRSTKTKGSSGINLATEGMYAYIEGKLTEQNPACVTVDCGGVGYEIHVSLHTYTQIKDKETVRLWVYQVVREDALLLFGFADKTEKELFLQLISVSGVGANTARVIISTLGPDLAVRSILDGDVKKIQSVKGIGLKTAQRVIVDLRDRLAKMDFSPADSSLLPQFRPERNEAVSALVTLGFAKNAVEKTVDGLLAKQPDLNTENIIKQALRML